MASLFGKNRLHETAQKIKTEEIQSFVDVVKTWHNDYHNGSLKSDKETSREQAYNQDFFIKILGYQEKPATPFSLEPKATTDKGQLPDAVLSHTDTEKDIKIIAAVVELKGTSIELDRPQRRDGNMSPVQQGFKYKTQYRNCPFVVVSNFWEFRLYRDNLLDYEVWTLDDLVNPDADFILFKTWYVLLNRENLTAASGASKTEALLSDIRIEQEEIGKKFYKVYKDARLELLRDIYKNNPEVKKNIDFGIEKAQKIIDRIVFACFAEDKGLLPDNTLHRIVKASEGSAFGGSLWSTLKGFFEAVDSGSEKLEIPDGYNGGLFKHDAELNNLKISDEPLKAVISLGSYNFEEDLSVTILGHIFEQSISDLEEIKNKVNESQNLETLAQSRRKKDGIFYTPDYVVRYIVDNSLGAYLRKREEECKDEFKLKGEIMDKTYEERERKAYEKYQTHLQNVKVLDPACGSGAFLVYVFDYLMAENKRVASILGSGLFSNDDYIRSILKNNIFGVDLNEESVEITKLSLWLKSAEKGKKLTSLDKNIKCGNSLIDDSSVSGTKAFNWNSEFKEILSSGGFDVVVGNPPYTYRNSITESEKNYFKNKYKSVERNFDLYKFFTEKLSTLTKEGGRSSFIIPNTFLSALTYKKLRSLILDEFSIEEIYDLGLDIFDDVVVESVIFSFEKNTNTKKSETLVKIQRDRKIDITSPAESYYLNIDKLARNNADLSFNIYLSPVTLEVVEKTRLNTIPLKDICYCTVGINTGYIKSELTSDKKIDSRYHKMLNGKDIGRHTISWPGEWIMYDPEFVKSQGDRGRSLPEDRIFEENKILVQRTRRGLKRKLVCCFDTEKFYNLNRLSNIVLNDKGFDLYYIYALLNSSLFDFYFNKVFNEYEIKPAHLSQLPIRKLSLDEQVEFSNKAKNVLLLSHQAQAEIATSLDFVVNTCYLAKVSKKLKSFYKLKFDEFLSEIHQESVSLERKQEWHQFFTEKSQQLKRTVEKLSDADREIDEMVFRLYDLTKNEVETVKEFYLRKWGHAEMGSEMVSATIKTRI